MNRLEVRSRYFEILIYDDYEYIDSLFDNIKNNYDYIYIKHDKDRYDDDSDSHNFGDLKKVHYHCCIGFDNAIKLSTIVDELQYPSNLINPIKRINKYLPYLLHYGYSDKFQYDLSEIEGTDVLVNKLVDLINNDKLSEKDSVIKIFDYINDSTCVITLSEIVKFSLDNNIWSTFRRNYTIINNYIKEHNVYCCRGD